MLTGIREREEAAKKFWKGLRYGAASVLTTVLTLALLAALLISLTPAAANLIAVGTGSVISYELNRRWVWRHAGRDRRWTMMMLFVSMSLVFLAVSSVAAELVGRSFQAGTVRTLVVGATTVAIFGLRWVAQYLLLDRVVFLAPEPQSLSAS